MFAGVGGMCLGFLNANNSDAEFTLEWANEIDKHACHTYRHNFKHALLEGDINSVLHPENSNDIEHYTKLHNQMFANPIDVLNGGFPCQSFSITGERKGLDDERGNLFLSVVDLINQLDMKFNQKPKFLLLENVKNLKMHDSGRTYSIIKSKFEECGYTIKEAILNTKIHSDLPQNRERLYIVGFLNKNDADKFTMFDNLERYAKDKTAEQRAIDIQNIINYTEQDKVYFYTKDKYPKFFCSQLNFNEEIDEMYQFYQLRRNTYIRKNQSNVCPTLTANMGTGGNNMPIILTKYGIRKLTPAETFKLQGFPIGNGYNLPTEYNGRKYANTQLYKQAGNAVSVPIVKLVAEELLRVAKPTEV